MDSYVNFVHCRKPLITEENLLIYRKRAFAIGGATILGGVLGAVTLPLLGFGAAGISSGSLAASWQSTIGLVPAGSAFASLQSLGASGMGVLWFGAVGAAAGSGALGLFGLVRRFQASGSLAASWESTIGLVPAGSALALLQSLGGTEIGVSLFGAVGAATGGGALGLSGLLRRIQASESLAASWQSTIGLVPASSAFALLQSLGATGIGVSLFGAVGAATGGGVLGLFGLGCAESKVEPFPDE